MAVMKFYNVSDFEEGDIFRMIIPLKKIAHRRLAGRMLLTMSLEEMER